MARKGLQKLVASTVLGSLALELDEESLSYICDILDQSDIEDEERAETISGILELQLSAADDPADGADSCGFKAGLRAQSLDLPLPPEASRIGAATDQVLQAASQYREAGPSESASEDEEEVATEVSPSTAPAPATRNEEVSDTARRKALLTAYGSVVDEVADDPREAAAAARQAAEREASSRDSMIADRVKMLDLKKKSRRKAEARQGSDLLAPNLNSAVAAHEIASQRDADAKKSRDKRDKDKADLVKQRADLANRKAERTKAAAKGERRA